MKVKRPEGLSNAEKAAWLESDEGRRFLDEATPMEGIRFVLAEPGLVPMTIRLPAELRTRIRRLAEARGMGYQTLARQWLLGRCAEEEAKAAKPRSRRATAREEPPADHAAG
jgi:hypothetical protein